MFDPAFPDHWHRLPLRDAAEWINGLAFKQGDLTGVTAPVIKITELKIGVGAQTGRTDETFDEKYWVEAGDVLFAWSGSPESSIGTFVWDGPSGWLNQHIFKVLPHHQWNATFFRFLLDYLQPQFIAIARNKQTTGLGHVTKSDLQRMIVGRPSRAEQEAIVDVLGPLQRKIDLNRRTIGTLEAMAEALFRSWFVDFDPVVAKADGREPFGMGADTAALFPDRLVDSEIGPVPEGWDVVPFGDIVDNVREKADPDAIESSVRYVGLEHIPRKSIFLTEHGAADDVSSAKSCFRAGDILFGKLRPYFHKVVRAPFDGICSTDILVLRATGPQLHALALMHAASRELVAHADAGSSGTRMPRARWEHMQRWSVAIPPEPLADRFSKIMKGLLDLGNHRGAENSDLAEARNALLPELLSGRIMIHGGESALAM